MTDPSPPPRTPTPLELDILIALGAGSLHGYGIVQDIETRGKSATHLRSGTLYLALRRLRDAGLIESTAPPSTERDGDARRKYFALTDAGRASAAHELRRLRDLVEAGRRRHLVEPERAP